MDDVVEVEVFDSLGALVEKFEGFRFAETHFDVLVVEQISIGRIFHDHVHLPFVLQRVPKLDDVWVIQLAVYLDLPLHNLQLSLASHGFHVHLRLRIATILMA